MVGQKRKVAKHYGSSKRYFNKGAEAENEGNEVDGIGTSDDSNGDNSDVESSIGEDELQDDDNSDNSENDVDEVESDNDEGETSDSEEAKYDSHEKITLSEEQKVSIKQHNDSPDTKEVIKPIDKLSEFQRTPEANEQSKKLEKNDSSVKKRKWSNEDSIETEVSPAKMLPSLDNEIASTLDKRREERNARSLFLKDLPPNTTAEMVKQLSPEIITVRVPLEGLKRPKSLYAFVEFESEDAAERNYRKLIETQIDNKKFIVDYVGEKSKFRRVMKEYPVNMRRLIVPNVPVDITADELKQHFPEARSSSIKLRGTKRLFFVSFETENEAKEAFKENANLKIHGKKITVLYAFKKKPGGIRKKLRKQPKIIEAVFEDEEIDISTNETQKEKSKENLETNSEVTKTTKKKSKKKRKSNLDTEKVNSQEHKLIIETTKMKGKRRK